MATDTQTDVSASAVLMERRHRITVAEYHRMLESGSLGDEPRVELLEGVILDKMTKDPPHVIATDLIDDLLHLLLPPGYFVSMGNPVTIEERDSEAEPDAQVFRGTPRDYAGRRRTQRDAALVIEVSDTSYRVDRGQKWITYAAAGIPVYWVVDLNRRVLEVHSEPAGAGDAARYARSQTFGPDDEAPIVLDGREAARFAVRDILP